MTERAQVGADRLCRIVMVGAIAITLARAFFLKEQPFDLLAGADNDDILRFLSVRDLLAGQGWFDAVQYRILPPEGLPLHWSRYVDAGIAGMVGAFALILPMGAAETATLVAWPLLMLTLVILATGTLGARALGAGAAAIAVLALIVWPVTSHTYFRTARLDHHNVQVLLTTLLVLAMIVPGRAQAMGLLGGLAAALSMAVGLETLPLVAMAALILAARAMADPGEDGARLLAFAAALALGGLAAFVGQTPPADWLLARCDQLSLPWLAVSGVGLVATLTLVVVARRISPTAGVAAFLATAALGLLAVLPLLLPCLAGPYANLPEDARALIPMIQEARPAHWFIQENPLIFFRNVAPALGAIAVAGSVWAHRTSRGLAGREETRALIVLLTLGTVAVAGTFFQIRIVVLTAATVPLLIGYGIAQILATRLKDPTPASAVALIVAGAVTFLPPVLYSGGAAALNALGPAPALAGTEKADPNCRDPEILRSLDTLPAGLIFNPINLGAPIVLLTEHRVLSAPYHRKAEALSNGMEALSADETTLRAALARTGADYLLLCRDADYGEAAFATNLAAGATAEGLAPLGGPNEALMVFSVSKR